MRCRCDVEKGEVDDEAVPSPASAMGCEGVGIIAVCVYACRNLCTGRGAPGPNYHRWLQETSAQASRRQGFRRRVGPGFRVLIRKMSAVAKIEMNLIWCMLSIPGGGGKSWEGQATCHSIGYAGRLDPSWSMRRSPRAAASRDASYTRPTVAGSNAGARATCISAGVE